MNTTTQRLVVAQLSRRFDPPAGTLVLDGVNLEAAPGETLAIVGPSGSGKSTLLNIIGALDKATAGHVTVDGVEVTTLAANSAAHYRAAKVGFVFQDHHLLPQLTGLENVLLPSLAGKKDPSAPKRAADLLDRVGVAPRAHAFPAQLSGGERQRVAIARALINRPTLLLCDEPTGNLDHENGAKIVELFVQLAAQQAVTILMATHNLELAARFGKCLKLTAGHLAEIGRQP